MVRLVWLPLQLRIMDNGLYAVGSEKMKRKEVTQVIESQRQEIMDRFPVKSLYLFGSTARDEAGPESDVDLLVEFSQPVSLFEFIELQQTLERILRCKVDLGTRRSLKLHLMDRVLQEAIRVA